MKNIVIFAINTAYIWEEIMLSRVTDLALEVRESFPDDNVEISGVKIIKLSLIHI